MTRGQYTTTSGRKVPNPYSTNINYGVQAIFFAHEATLGATYIDLSALSMPASLSSKGYVNPSATRLQSLYLAQNKSRLKIISSVRGEVMKTSYSIPNNMQISFEGFTASAGEIFECTLDPQITTGHTIVDARPMVRTYLLPEGEDEVVVEPFEYFKFPTMQIGAVMVFRGASLTLQLRNVGNATAAPGADGNYQEISSTTGFSSTIKFNTAAGVGGENVSIISVGSLVEKPTESIMNHIDSISGSLYKVIETLAVLAGVPEANFSFAPSSLDLLAFWEKVQAYMNETTHNIVVGSATQLSEGKCTTTSVQAAINACPIGGKILVLDGVYTENITISSKMCLVGKGHGSVIDGTLTLSTDYCTIRDLKFTGNITISAGADRNFLRDCFLAAGKSVTDSGTGNSVLTITEV